MYFLTRESLGNLRGFNPFTYGILAQILESWDRIFKTFEFKVDTSNGRDNTSNHAKF